MWQEWSVFAESLSEWIGSWFTKPCGSRPIDVREAPKVAIDAAKCVGIIRWISNIKDFHVRAGNASGLAWATGTLYRAGYLLTAGHVFDPRSSENVVKPVEEDRELQSGEIATLMEVDFSYER